MKSGSDSKLQDFCRHSQPLQEILFVCRIFYC